MGLFDKKFCSVCGEKIGLLGNRKLDDGNLCKNCAKKLSPWFNERRHSTVEQIKEQLAYREANKELVEQFRVTRSLGINTKLLLDENTGRFMVSSSKNLLEENPDVLEFSQVLGCTFDIDESRSEIRRELPDGKSVSYNPPRYEYSFDFYIVLNVDAPWFDQIRFKLNNCSVDGDSRGEYDTYKELGDEIKAVFSEARASIASANAPKQARTCPHCGATTFPDASGCCEYCGGAL